MKQPRTRNVRQEEIIVSKPKSQQAIPQYQYVSVKLRAEIADILRKDDNWQYQLEACLGSILQNLDGTFTRLWLIDDTRLCLNLIASAGDAPPHQSIHSQVRIGEFAVGKVAAQNKPFVSNDILSEKKLIQNQSWARRKYLTSFAGYPLLSKDGLVGVITLFSQHHLSEDVLDILASVSDILAQEILRRDIENKLNQARERYEAFIKQSSEGIWRFELDQPVSISLSTKQQIDKFYKYAYLAECNDALAKMYGYEKADDIVGARLGDMLVRDDVANIDYLKAFISSGYKLANAQSSEIDKYGNRKYIQNSLVGIIENKKIVRAWGTQQDITEQKVAEDELIKLSHQKDEFIAIASHELKTPLTTIKAFTQVMRERFKRASDEQSMMMLGKMETQIDKLTKLISDLLDATKIEAGKLQYHNTQFSANTMIDEIVEAMQLTSSKHRLIKNLDRDCNLLGDQDRIGQVIINFLSNAIKYSPYASKIIIKSKVNNNKLMVSVKDFGEGISDDEQAHIFDRFYRGENPTKITYPGLGLGLYISSEIIKRHHGKIGVKSKQGKSTTFYFTLPIHVQ
jgi:signal transduction histidine kinase